MDLIVVYLIVVGVLLMIGLLSLMYTLPMVNNYWRPSYWVGVGLVLALVTAFVLAIISRYGVILPEDTVLYILETALSLVAFEMILIPYTHRRERDLCNSEARYYWTQQDDEIDVEE